jgi:hypothetical protein
VQTIPSDYTMPQRLTCSGCRHWQETAMQRLGGAEASGRCDRFGESRPATARPRCNICWEPVAALPAKNAALSDD